MHDGRLRTDPNFTLTPAAQPRRAQFTSEHFRHFPKFIRGYHTTYTTFNYTIFPSPIAGALGPGTRSAPRGGRRSRTQFCLRCLFILMTNYVTILFDLTFIHSRRYHPAMDDRLEVRNRVRELRVQMKLRQADLANQVNVTRQTILAIEKGRLNPSIRLSLKIARVLGRPVDHVFFLSEETGAETIRADLATSEA